MGRSPVSLRSMYLLVAGSMGFIPLLLTWIRYEASSGTGKQLRLSHPTLVTPKSEEVPHRNESENPKSCFKYHHVISSTAQVSLPALLSRGYFLLPAQRTGGCRMLGMLGERGLGAWVGGCSHKTPLAPDAPLPPNHLGLLTLSVSRVIYGNRRSPFKSANNIHGEPLGDHTSHWEHHQGRTGLI